MQSMKKRIQTTTITINYAKSLNTFLMTISQLTIGNLIVWGIGLFVHSEYRYAKKYIFFGPKKQVKYFVF